MAGFFISGCVCVNIQFIFKTWKRYALMIPTTSHCYNLQSNAAYPFVAEPPEALQGALAHDTPSTGQYGSIIALGNFDGVHLGHQAILNHTVGWAAKVNATPCVFSFANHPKQVLRPDSPFLQLGSFNERLLRLQQHGMAWACCPTFNADWANLTPDAFVQDVLIGTYHARAIVVGYDFCFGKNRQGSAEWLQANAERLGIAVHVHPPVQLPKVIDNDPTDDENTLQSVSSSGVREMLLNLGDVETATRWLGRGFGTVGTVEQGFQRGRTVGFPTANLRLHDASVLLPKQGVYAAWVVEKALHSVPRLAMVNIGTSPTYEGGTPTPRIEAHVLDASPEWNVYGQPLALVWLARLREEQTFESVRALVAQLERDKATVQGLSASLPPLPHAEQQLLKQELKHGICRQFLLN